MSAPSVSNTQTREVDAGLLDRFAAIVARWDDMGAVMNRIVTRLHGSISAEHGIGQLKRTLDPNGILNPGRVL